MFGIIGPSLVLVIVAACICPPRWLKRALKGLRLRRDPYPYESTGELRRRYMSKVENARRLDERGLETLAKSERADARRYARSLDFRGEEVPRTVAS